MPLSKNYKHAAIAAVLLLNLSYASAQDNLDNGRIFWVEKIGADGVAHVQEYQYSSTYQTQLRNIEVWQDRVETEDPLEVIYFEHPDIELELIKRGYAKLLNIESAPLPQQEAELDARSRGEGRWGGGKVLKPAGQSPRWNNFLTWENAKAGIVLWGGLGAAITAAWAVTVFVIGLVRRKRVPLVFLGPYSVGKTWLWSRIREPEITREDLLKLDRTAATQREPAYRPEPMGNFLVTPLYIDTPGGQPGRQVAELMKKRLLIKRKSVWIILLATTPTKSITRSSPDADKIDHSYIHEQLGYLALPLGMLTAPKTPKPNLLVVVVSKFDLFSDHDPGHSEAQAAKELLRSTFSQHIDRLEEECKNYNVAFRLEYCSALEGWRTESIARHIKDVLFLK